MTRVSVPISLDDGATLPQYETAHAAGMDLRSVEAVVLEPLERRLIPTGLRIAIPPGFEGQVRPRSGLALKYGIAMVNSPGTIDADYRGEIRVLAINLGSETVHLGKGERIAQLVLCPVARAEWSPVDALEESERGEGGFGSTGTA